MKQIGKIIDGLIYCLECEKRYSRPGCFKNHVASKHVPRGEIKGYEFDPIINLFALNGIINLYTDLEISDAREGRIVTKGQKIQSYHQRSKHRILYSSSINLFDDKINGEYSFICPWCKKKERTNHKNKKFCSAECRTKFYSLKNGQKQKEERRENKSIICPMCKTSFYPTRKNQVLYFIPLDVFQYRKGEQRKRVQDRYM